MVVCTMHASEGDDNKGTDKSCPRDSAHRWLLRARLTATRPQALGLTPFADKANSESATEVSTAAKFFATVAAEFDEEREPSG